MQLLAKELCSLLGGIMGAKYVHIIVPLLLILL